MSFNMYQLRLPIGLQVGDAVFIDGPYDRWGNIIDILEDNIAQEDDNQTLYLIRGTGDKK